MMFYVAILLACTGPAVDGCFVAVQPDLYVSLKSCLEDVDAHRQRLEQVGITVLGGCSAVSTGEPV